RVSTNNVLVQHLRLRVGDAPTGPSPDNRDSLKIEGGTSVHSVVIDHISASWAVDENVSIWGNGIRDITISNSIISEGLDNSLHPKGPHSKGLIVGGDPEPKRVSIIGNLFAHNFERNALLSSGVFANNVVYNWVWRATQIRPGSDNSANEVLTASVVGNVYIKGPSDNAPPAIHIGPLLAGSHV